MAGQIALSILCCFTVSGGQAGRRLEASTDILWSDSCGEHVFYILQRP